MKYVIIVSALIGIAILVDIVKTRLYLRRLDREYEQFRKDFYEKKLPNTFLKNHLYPDALENAWKIIVTKGYDS